MQPPFPQAMLDLCWKISSSTAQMLQEKPLPKKPPHLISGALFQHTLDICDAIIILLEGDTYLPGPALTLCRSMAESFARGVWVIDLASDEELKNFTKGKKQLPQLGAICKVLDHSVATHRWLYDICELNGKDWHDLTHGGAQHIIRRGTNSESLQPDYPTTELITLAQIRNEFVMNATGYLLLLMDLMQENAALNKLKQSWQNEVFELTEAWSGNQATKR